MKIIYLITMFLLIINNVSATTIINDSTTAELYTYSNNLVDSQYKLSYTDSFNEITILYNCNENIICKHTEILKDNLNNTLIVKREIVKTVSYFIFTSYKVNFSIVFNNKLLMTGNTNKIESTTKFLDGSSRIGGFFDNTISVPLNQSYFFNNLKIESSNINIISINFKYGDSSVSAVKNYIETSKNSLNIIFRLIYEIIVVIPNGFSWLNMIDDKTIIELQLFLLQPLLFLNTLIDFIIFIINFVLTKGILWFFSICEMVMFIFAYGKEKNSNSQIADTIITFIEFNKSYFRTVFNILAWLYEKLLVVLARLFRGGG